MRILRRAFGRSLPRSSSRRRRGAFTLFSAIAALILVGLVGLALDTAWALTARMQLQRTADAAALAAAAQLNVPGQSSYSLARQAAIDTALENRVVGCGTSGIVLDANASNSVSGDIVVGEWRFDTVANHFYFDPTSSRPDAVRVRAGCGSTSQNPALALLFGSLFGQRTAEGGRTAIARQGRSDDALLLVLDPGSPAALLMNGGAILDVEAGTIQVNSNAACALQKNGGSGEIRAQRTRIVGTACGGSGITGDVIEGCQVVPDPLASLPEPNPVALGLANLPPIRAGGNFGPGYYAGGIDMNGGTATLQPGIYVIGNQGPGQGIHLVGQSQLVGTGVTIFLQNGARLRSTGGSGISITPPSSGTYAAISFFQARGNAAIASIQGLGTWNFGGTMYLPAGTVSMGGNVGRTIGRIITGKLDISGNGNYQIVGPPPPPTTPNFVYLIQ
jgi:Flp pilus assembly protein TadG